MGLLIIERHLRHHDVTYRVGTEPELGPSDCLSLIPVTLCAGEQVLPGMGAL